MVIRNGWNMLVIQATAPEDQTFQIGPGARDLYRRGAGEVLLPDREPRSVLDELRREMGSMTYAAQYQQDPVPAEGNIIRREWLRYVSEAWIADVEAQPGGFGMYVSSWDLASTIMERSSFSVGQLWAVRNREYYLIDTVRVRLEVPDLRNLMIETMTDWRCDANVVENTDIARAIVQDLKHTTDVGPILLSTPQGSKEVRLSAQAARFESGQVHLPEDAPWLALYLKELLAFPVGKSDDQVDATSLALNYITGREARRRDLVRRNPIRRNIVRRGREENGE